jgi:hypothetical protein
MQRATDDVQRSAAQPLAAGGTGPVAARPKAALYPLEELRVRERQDRDACKQRTTRSLTVCVSE